MALLTAVVSEVGYNRVHPQSLHTTTLPDDVVDYAGKDEKFGLERDIRLVFDASALQGGPVVIESATLTVEVYGTKSPTTADFTLNIQEIRRDTIWENKSPVAHWSGSQPLDVFGRCVADLTASGGGANDVISQQEAGTVLGAVLIKKEALHTGLSTKPVDKVGQYFQAPAGSGNLLKSVRPSLQVFFDGGTGPGGQGWWELWTAQNTGIGQHGYEPLAFVAETTRRNTDTFQIGSYVDALFTFPSPPAILAKGHYVIVFNTDGASFGPTRYIGMETLGNTPSGLNSDQGDLGNLLIYGQGFGFVSANYTNAFEYPALESIVVAWTGIPGDYSAGDQIVSVDISPLIRNAIVRTGFQDDGLIGLILDGSPTNDGEFLSAAMFDLFGGAFAYPTLSVVHTPAVAPVIDNLPPAILTTVIGTTFALTATVSAGTLPLTWTITDPPAGIGGPATIDSGSGAISWTPLHVGQVGAFQIKVAGLGGTDTASWNQTCIARLESVPLVPLVERTGRPLEVSSAAVAEVTVEMASQADLEILAASHGKGSTLPAGAADVTIGDASPGDLEVEEAEPE